MLGQKAPRQPHCRTHALRHQRPKFALMQDDKTHLAKTGPHPTATDIARDNQFRGPSAGLAIARCLEGIGSRGDRIQAINRLCNELTVCSGRAQRRGSGEGRHRSRNGAPTTRTRKHASVQRYASPNPDRTDLVRQKGIKQYKDQERHHKLHRRPIHPRDSFFAVGVVRPFAAKQVAA